MTTHDSPAQIATRIRNAIAGLIDERAGSHTQLDNDGRPKLVRVYRASVYDEMRAELGGQQGTSFGGVARSMPPAWIDGITWVHDVDATVEGWAQQFAPYSESGRVGTVIYPWTTQATITLLHLRRLATISWPTDDLILEVGAKIARRIAQWSERAAALLHEQEQHKLEVVAPCPQCETRWVYRPDSAGERVRQAALQMTVDGCKCFACKVIWSHDHLSHLSAVLDYEREHPATPEPETSGDSEELPEPPRTVAGHRNGRARLSAEQVASIREQHKAGDSIRTIATRYNVGRSQIQRIISRQRWNTTEVRS